MATKEMKADKKDAKRFVIGADELKKKNKDEGKKEPKSENSSEA